MTPFDYAYSLLKTQFYFDSSLDTLYKMGRVEDALKMQQMRQFVIENMQSPDPAKRAAAEEMKQYLTQLMSHLSGRGEEMGPHEPKINLPDEGPRPIAQQGRVPSAIPMPKDEPMYKAWTIYKALEEERLVLKGS